METIMDVHEGPQPGNAVLSAHISVPTNIVKKNHTCGSLFAKCNCNASSATALTPPKPAERRKTLFQSYSHPDTAFVFTDENKNPSRDRQMRIIRAQSTPIRTKRLSTPCIGNYTVLDVAVHPEVVLTMSHTNGTIEPRYAETGVRARPKPILKKSITFQNDNGYMSSFREEQHQRKLSKSLSENSGRDEQMDPSRRDSILRPTFEKKYSKLNVTDNFEATQSDNMEYLKYNALSYQQGDAEAKSHYQHPKGATATDDIYQRYTNEQLIAQLTNGTDDFTRKVSRSIGDTSRIQQLRNYAMLRKQSECNEGEYMRKQQTQNMQLEDEVNRLKDTISERDNEINKLRREIHKLKSVLQQTTKPVQVSADGDLLSSLQTHHRMAGQQTMQSNNSTAVAGSNSICSNHNNNNVTNIPATRTNGISNAEQNVPQSGQQQGHQRPYLHTLSLPTAVKKQGVSGESSDTTGQLSRDILIPKYEKDFRSKQLIKTAIMDNDFLKNIDSSQVRELVESMYSLEVGQGEYVIREGEAGAHLFVSAEGDFEVIKDGKVLGKMGAGKAFGELAILYNCTRTASIKVLSDSRVWVLDRRVFQQIMMRTGMQRIEENISFLRSVPLLQNLSNNLLAKIADVLEVEFYPAGAYVIRQGASGDAFFLISQGTVKVTQKRPGSVVEEEEIRTLSRGDYFGEQALIKEDKRTANIIAMSPGVECLTLDRESFNQLIGDLCELREKDYGDASRVLSMKRTESKGLIFGSDTKQELLDIELDSLHVVATLGIGGFGRVELVKHEKDGQVNTYALKCLKKRHIVDTHQEEHVFSERTIMLSCKSPFICRLYRTYRDSKFVYMLLEACMGGEIWTILRDRGNFDDANAQFIIGCVLQAFEYLHNQGIVYRDLKPENLMLNDAGYVKLVDFGFSKYIGYSSKTWTFCGTPEYVAPEIILNKGHDRAVDYWALGVLIHELLTGTPPFTASDPMKTYNIILKGIDMVNFPKHMSRSAIQLIKRLCRDIPAERLGYQRGGTQDIKKHKWFQNFDWDGLANLSMSPPLLQPVTGPLDIGNFDSFPMDTDVPVDECSGWDAGF